MNKYILFLIIFIFFNNCSLNSKSNFWTKTQKIENDKEKLEEVFKSEKELAGEFNQNLKIKINAPYLQNPFISNLTNNFGYVNFSSEFKKTSKFKFKKIKNFEYINPDLLLGKDKSLIFFDEKGSILKFSQDSKLIWKKNYYDKKEIKQKPTIYFATDNNILIVADSLAKLYAMDYSNGNILWKKINTTSFNSEIKIIDDKVFIVDLDNRIKCISLKDGKEIWNFNTEKSFIKSQKKISLVVYNDLVTFMDTFGDINALDLNTGKLVWQTQTINEDIYESSFLIKSSRLVYDNGTIFVSNNQNKLFAIDSKNGFVKWEQLIKSDLEPTIIDNLLITISENGYLFILDNQNGNLLRSTYILGNLNRKKIRPTGFIVAKNFIYVSLSNGRLLKVNITDGRTKDIIKIDSNKISRPYILDKKMYVLKDDAIIKIE